MPVLDASCQVERLRKIADSNNNQAVQTMPPPSYLEALLYEGNSAVDSGLSPDIVMVYKANTKTSSSSLPLDVRDEIDVSIESDIELGGDPLPAPFEENDDFELSMSEKKQHHWPKGELNHYPLKLSDALNILNKLEDFSDGTANTLDIWCLVDGGVKKDRDAQSDNEAVNGKNTMGDLSELDLDTSNCTIDSKMNEKVRILLGEHSTENWWTRSFVESQGLCSIASPEMDPEIMKKSHMDIAQMPEWKINAVVLCRYNISGQRFTTNAPPDCPSSVSLELEWKKLSVGVPLQEASAKVLAQAAVGHKSSLAHGMWKQLCVVHKLFEVLLTCWRDKVTPEMLPHLDSASEDSDENSIPQESLQSRIQTLIMGGKQALQAQIANRRMSMAPALLNRHSLAPGSHGRLSMAPGFLGRMSIAPRAMKEMGGNETKSMTLNEALDIAAAGNRENSDVTDGLFSLLIECKTYRELTTAWDLTFMELNEARRAYVRPKNSTRAAKLIQGFVSGQLDSTPDFMEIDGSLYPLELLIELGLEKLTTDYSYIFQESQLVGRDELLPPSLVRAGLGVPRDKWLASCGQLLGWLAQVHCALEIVLPLQNSLSSYNVQAFMTSRALKYFQSEMSPVRSVAGLLAPGGFVQEFSATVSTDAVHEHINKKFDWWRMTLTSECETKKVRSVFLRSHLRPIFPPQLYDHCEALVPAEGIENVQYYCAEAVTISTKF